MHPGHQSEATSERASATERFWRLGSKSYVTTRRETMLWGAIDAVFGEMAVPRPSNASDAKRSLELDLRRVEGSWRLFGNGLPIVRMKDAVELAPVLEGTLVGYAVRTRRDAAVLHAASVQIRTHAVLLPGGKGSGKSTLALSLARQGARYFGDELAFVRFEDGALEAFPKAVTLKEGSFPLFPDQPTYRDPVRGLVRYHRAPLAAGLGETVRLEQIVFPRYVAGSNELKVTELEPHQTAK